MRRRKVKRGNNGRWQKGTASPNPRGRPKRKKPARPFDPGEIRDFMNQQVVMKDGTTILRKQLLLLKMYEDAMKGKVTNQRFLLQRHDEATAAIAKLGFEYHQLLSIWIIDNQKLADLHYKAPEAELRQMRRIHILMHQVNPERYPQHMTPDKLIEIFRERHWAEKRRREADAAANAATSKSKGQSG